MAMLACVHHISWVKPIEGGKHQCQYCKEVVTKKDVYPKFEDLGAAFAAKWDRHEKGEPQETVNTAPMPGGLTEA
jgi:hypothetical protein